MGSFHLQRVNKLYQKYAPVRITQQKEHLLIWNSKTTQNLNIYLHNYQTQTAIFLATKHEKKIGMTCSYLNFSIYTGNTSKQQKKMMAGFCEELLSENDFETVLIRFCYEYIIVPMLEAVQKQRLAQGRCWSYANSLNS